jgi:hypothetical protein
MRIVTKTIYVLLDIGFFGGCNYDNTTEANKLAKAMAGTFGWFPATRTGAPGNSDYPEKQNASGFSAIPGGARSSYNYFYDQGELATWWTDSDGWSRYITYNF